MKFVALSLLLLAGACSNESAPLTAADVVVTKPMPGMAMSAGYFSMTNHSANVIEITRVTSPQFDAVEMHETVIEDDIARMVKLDSLQLEAGETATFEPGGKHLMLMRPQQSLESVRLDFYSADTVVLSVNVPITE